MNNDNSQILSSMVDIGAEQFVTSNGYVTAPSKRYCSLYVI